jgi:hypothetical protein
MWRHGYRKKLKWKQDLFWEELKVFLLALFLHLTGHVTLEIRSPAPKRSTTSFFGQLSDLFTDEEGTNEERSSSAMVEMQAYNKQKCIDPEADPLMYWKVVLFLLLCFGRLNEHHCLGKREDFPDPCKNCTPFSLSIRNQSAQ